MNRTKLFIAILACMATLTSCQRSYTCYCMDLTDYTIVSTEDIGKNKRSTAKYICQQKQTTANLQCTLEYPVKER
jgi:hypothetical protein